LSLRKPALAHICFLNICRIFVLDLLVDTKQNIKTSTDNRNGQLRAILYLLQTNLEEFSEEVERSYELLKLGEKTELSKTIEDSIEDPLSSIFNISVDIDNRIKNIVDRIVKSYLKHNSAIVQTAYRTNTIKGDLHYSIVLKNDNMVNRNRIFDFFDKYDLLEVSQKYPVYFQFVPVDLAEKIQVCEALELNEE